MQLDLFKQQTIRSVVLESLNSTNHLISARDLATKSGVKYEQVVFALLALHNAGKIYRQGKKTTAMWGRLDLEPQNDSSYDMLEKLFHGIVRR